MTSERQLVRFPHDPDPWALWEVLERSDQYLLVRRHGVRQSNQRRRLESLSLVVLPEDIPNGRANTPPFLKRPGF